MSTECNISGSESDADRHAALKAKLVETYIQRPSDDAVATFLKETVEARQAWVANLPGSFVPELDLPSDETPDFESRSIVVTGSTGAGKSRMVKRGLSRLNLTSTDPRRMRILRLRVPGPCTLLTLGRCVARAVGYPIADNVREHVTWEIVRRQLALAGVEILHLDEIQNVSETANVSESVRVLNTLKALMTCSVHPVSLVLTGLPSFVGFVQADGQVRRRCNFVQLETFGLSDEPTLTSVLEALAERAGLRGVHLGGDLVPRLLHAGQGQVGLTMEIAVNVVMRAVSARNQGCSEERAFVHIGHFADEHAARTGNADLANPFLADDWHRLDMDRVGIVSLDQERYIDETPTGSPSLKRRSARPRTA